MTQYRFSRDEIADRRSSDGVRSGCLLFDPKEIPGATCSMGLIRFAQGGSGAPHQHEVEVEVFFGLRGSGEVEFLGKVHPLAPGVAVYVPPRTLHQIRNVGDGELEFLATFAPALDLDFIREWQKVEG